MTQAEKLVKISAEIAAFQRDAVFTRGLTSADGEERTNFSSITVKRRAEPLITKAYNAFRRGSNTRINTVNEELT